MNFRLGSIPVQVHGSFFLTMLFFGMGDMKVPVLLVVWVLGAFVAVLAHELGHALAGRMFGLVPAIQLHGMGGTTSWPGGKRLTPGRQIVVSLAGPLVGIVLGVGMLVGAAYVPHSPLVGEAITRLVWVTLGWGVLNLLPILPMDGGAVMSAFFQLFSPKRGENAARVVSILTALFIAAVALKYGVIFGGILAGVYLVRNVQLLMASAKPKVDEAPLAAALAQAYVALEAQDGAAAVRLAEPVFVQAESPELKVTAIRVLAYARLLEGQWGHVMSILERFAPVIGPEDLEKFERTAAELGRVEDAARIRALRLAEPTGVGPAVEGFRA